MSKRKNRKNEKYIENNNSQNRLPAPAQTPNTPPTDRSVVVHQRNKIKNPLSIFQRNFTDKQKKFLDVAFRKDTKMMLINGPAGSTKSYLSIYVGLMMMSEKRVSDLIYVRSVVESSDNKMGYLPGESKEKLAPYIEPLLEKLDELLPKNEIQFLINDNRIHSLPVGFLRGLSWNAKFVFMDEAQNCTQKELITFMTRIGEFSKVFICGDTMQSDIGTKSGFKKICDTFNDEESKRNGIYTFEFTEDDILRSELVKFIVKKIKNI